jgi:hypothetical protein
MAWNQTRVMAGKPSTRRSTVPLAGSTSVSTDRLAPTLKHRMNPADQPVHGELPKLA